MLNEDSPNSPADPALPLTVNSGETVVHNPQNYAMTAAVCVGGLLVPGLGHLILQRWVRGFLLLGSVILMFLLGLKMQGALSFFPDAGSLVSFQTLKAFANIGVGLPYFLATRAGYSEGVPTAPTADYGWLFLIVAGLLNYLIVLDAFDISRGRKP
jgi:hypothetical protein